jgi:hypothetical protein
MKYSITVFDENDKPQDLPGYTTLVEAISTIKVLNRSCILNEVRVWFEIKAATMTTIAERVEKHSFQPTSHWFDDNGEYVTSHNERDPDASFEYDDEKVMALSGVVEEILICS